MTNWVEIGKLSDIPKRGARCVSTPMGRVGVFRTAADEIYAIEDRCPHKGGPLSQGIVHGSAVTCPLHNWVLSLETGTALGADEGEVRRFDIMLEGEMILLDVAVMAVAAD